MRHVQLVEAGGLAVGFGDGFDGGGACGGEAVREVQFLGDSGDGKFAGGVVDFVDADRGESNRSGHLVAEDGGCGVPQVGVDELPRDDSVAEEGLPIGKMGVGLACVGGGIVPVHSFSR